MHIYVVDITLNIQMGGVRITDLMFLIVTYDY